MLEGALRENHPSATQESLPRGERRFFLLYRTKHKLVELSTKKILLQAPRVYRCTEKTVTFHNTSDC